MSGFEEWCDTYQLEKPLGHFAILLLVQPARARPEAVVACHDLDHGAIWTGVVFRGQRSSRLVQAAGRICSIVVAGNGLAGNSTAKKTIFRDTWSMRYSMDYTRFSWVPGSFRASSETLSAQSSHKGKKAARKQLRTELVLIEQSAQVNGDAHKLVPYCLLAH